MVNFEFLNSTGLCYFRRFGETCCAICGLYGSDLNLIRSLWHGVR